MHLVGPYTVVPRGCGCVVLQFWYFKFGLFDFVVSHASSIVLCHCVFDFDMAIVCSFYKGEGDCYHSDWAVPCSHAGSYSNCEASAGCWFDNHNVEVVPIHSTSLECIKGFQFDSDCFHSNWEVPMSHSGSKSTCEASGGCWIYSSLEATAAFNGTMSV